jgi:hypothetical protein
LSPAEPDRLSDRPQASIACLVKPRVQGIKTTPQDFDSAGSMVPLRMVLKQGDAVHEKRKHASYSAGILCVHAADSWTRLSATCCVNDVRSAGATG